MKLNLRRILIFFLIIGLSVGFGFAFDAIADRIERNRYPLDATHRDLIAQESQAFGIPEATLWALVHTESGFVSNAIGENGEVGLLQLTPEQLTYIYCEILGEEPPVEGLLFDPKTNLHAGCAWLSTLYQKYGTWETALTAWHEGEAQTDLWLADPALTDELGHLKSIPSKEAERFVSRTLQAMEQYTRLYF